MINRFRLLQVDKSYPNVPRRLGKTTYVYDCLLRSAQTHYYDKLFYVTSTADYARESIKGFIDFLRENDVFFRFNDTNNRITIFSYDGRDNKEIDILFIGFLEHKHHNLNFKERAEGLYYFTDFFHDKFLFTGKKKFKKTIKF